MLYVFMYSCYMYSCYMYSYCIREGDAFLLSSEDGKKTEITEIQELSSQEETETVRCMENHDSRVLMRRFHLLKAKCGSEDKITNNTNVGISNMLPCSDSLREHVRRVNYQVAIWK